MAYREVEILSCEAGPHGLAVAQLSEELVTRSVGAVYVHFQRERGGRVDWLPVVRGPETPDLVERLEHEASGVDHAVTPLAEHVGRVLLEALPSRDAFLELGLLRWREIWRQRGHDGTKNVSEYEEPATYREAFVLPREQSHQGGVGQDPSARLARHRRRLELGSGCGHPVERP